MKLKYTALSIVLSSCILCFSIQSSEALAASSFIINTLSTTGEGKINQSHGKQTKAFMIFQPAGWVGYAYPPHKETSYPYNFRHAFTWPKDGGVNSFINRSSAIYLKQMEQIKSLSPNIAVAALIMPDVEGGMVTCFNGQMSQRVAVCNSGQLMTTKQLIPHVKHAAWMKGLQVAPFFSITNLDPIPAGKTKGQYTLEKLKHLTEWWMGQLDGTAVKTSEGKVVILTESINSGLELGSAEQAAVINYMNSRSDILWVDNLANADQNPAIAANNVLRSGANSDIASQEWLKSIWGDRYRYHHINKIADCRLYVNSCTRSPAHGEVKYSSEEDRLKTLNIIPHHAGSYPIVISQWNEYSEWLVYEPSEYNGLNEYYYLQWRLSQQP